jgi:hypothetical protein
MDASFWAAVAAISQAATVGVAGWALIYARGQVKEARDTRERVAQPEVVVFVDRHEVRRYMDLVIKNFGQTTAYNVRLTLPALEVAPSSNRRNEGVETLYVPEKLAVLAPGQEWRTMWDSAVRRENYNGDLKDQYGGFVEFDDKVDGPGKRSYRNPIALDIKMFWNTTWIEQKKGKSVEKALYEIAGTLEKYGQEHEGIWVYTDPGDVERKYDIDLAAYREGVHDQVMREMGVIRDDAPVDGDHEAGGK